VGTATGADDAAATALQTVAQEGSDIGSAESAPRDETPAPPPDAL
jgi:hypothetical protein